MSRFLLQQVSPLCLTVAVLLAYAVASATAEHAESTTQDQQASLFRLCNLGRTTVELGSAEHFAVLSTGSVTDAGGSQINGDMGTSTGTTLPVYAPYSPGTPGLNGDLHPNTATAIDARAAAISALDDIKSRSDCETELGGVVELGGRTLTPGLYTSTESMHLTSGNLILDALGHPNAVFIFRTPGLITSTENRKVLLAGGANPNHIFWSAGTGANFAAYTTMEGNIFAGTDITYAAYCTHHGRAFAMGTACTLSSTLIGAE